MWKRINAMLLVIALIVTSITYTPKTVNAADYDELNFTEVTDDTGENSYSYYIMNNTIESFVGVEFLDIGTTMQFTYASTNLTEDTIIMINGVVKTAEDQEVTFIGDGSVKLDPRLFEDDAYTEVEVTTTTGSATVIVKKESPEPEIVYNTNAYLTAACGEGSRYTEVGTIQHGEIRFNETYLHIEFGSQGRSINVDFNGTNYGENPTSTAMNAPISYTKFKAGINVLTINEVTADGEEVTYVMTIETPVRPNNVYINNYAKYTGKYIFKFDKVDNAKSYNVYVDDSEEPVASLGGSGDYVTSEEVAAYEAGEHTFYVTGVYADGTESNKSAGVNTTLEAAGTNNDIAQVYIQTNDKTMDAMDFEKSMGNICASITIIDKNGGDYVGKDIYEEVDGKTALKVRGNSTANADKKAFNIKFNSKYNVFGMGSAKKWSMLANAFDKALIRNKLAMEFALDLGLENTSQSKYVDFYLNGRYMGNYLLIESVEAGSTRVDIDSTNTKVENNDILLELENNAKVEDGVDYISTTRYGQRFNLNSPERGDISDEWIENKMANTLTFLNNFETDLANNAYDNYSQYIDIDSFVNFYIVNEVFKNQDFDFSSTRFYIKNNILYAGPLWDLDLSSGNAKASLSSEGFRAQNMAWYREMMKNNTFKQKVIKRFYEVLPRIESIYSGENNGIDTLVAEIQDSITRNYTPIAEGGAGWSMTQKDSADGYSYADAGGWSSYEVAIDYLKNWFEERTVWLKEQWEEPDDSSVVTINSGIKDYYSKVTIDSVEYTDYANYNINDKSTADASSINGAKSPMNAIEGIVNSGWESNHGNDDEWIVVDLGDVYSFKQITLWWEAASAAKYNIQVSMTGEEEDFTTIKYVKSSVGGNRTDEIEFTELQSARYVRMQGIERLTGYGYQLFEFAIYVQAEDDEPTVNAVVNTTTGIKNYYNSVTIDDVEYADNANFNMNRSSIAYASSENGKPAMNAVEGIIDRGWESQYGNDKEWITVDLGAIYSIKQMTLWWEAASAAKYNIQVSMTGEEDDFTTIQYVETSMQGGRTDEIIFTELQRARYVRMQGVQRMLTAYGYQLFEIGIYSQPEVAVGGTLENNDGTISLSWAEDANAAKYEISYVTDGERKIVEVGSDITTYIFEEWLDNNTDVRVTAVEDGGTKYIICSTTALADLVISDMYVTGGSAIVDRPFTVYSVVENIGTAVAPGGVEKAVTITGQDNIPANHNAAYTETLCPGDTITIGVVLTASEIGFYTLTGIVDDVGRILESNLTNNTKTCNVVIVNEKTLSLSYVDGAIVATWNTPDTIGEIEELVLTYVSYKETKQVKLGADVTSYTIPEFVDDSTDVTISVVYKDYESVRLAGAKAQTPIEVFGHVIDTSIAGQIAVQWANPGNGQTFNVYIDDEIATDINGVRLQNVNCAKYVIRATGEHIVRITGVLNGIETAGVTQETAVEEPQAVVTITPGKGVEYNDHIMLNNEVFIDHAKYNVNPNVKISASTGNNSADLAIDGNIGSRWESEQNDPQYVTIDLGDVESIKKISIWWETASAGEYYIQTSTDGQEFKNVQTVVSATQERVDEILFQELQSARYVRIYGVSRNTGFGYSIWEIAVYGESTNVVGGFLENIDGVISLQWVEDEEALGYEISYTADGVQKTVSVEAGISIYEFDEWIDNGTAVSVKAIMPEDESYQIYRTTALADLIISDIYVVDGVAIVNKQFVVRSIVKNIGTAAIQDGAVKAVTIAGQDNIPGNYNAAYTGRIVPGESVTIDIPLTASAIGVYTLNAIADEVNRVLESNRTNNTNSCAAVIINEKNLALSNEEGAVTATWDTPDSITESNALFLTYISNGETKTVELAANATSYTFTEPLDNETEVSIAVLYNQYGTVKFAKATALADLIIVDTTVSNDDIKLYDQFNVTATVKNIGTAQVAGAPEGSDITSDETYGYSISVTVGNQTGIEGGFDASYRSGLLVGQTVEITVPNIRATMAGTYDLVVKVDDIDYVPDGTGFIKESNENNNTAAVSIVVNSDQIWRLIPDANDDELFIKYGRIGTTEWERVDGKVYWNFPVTGVTNVNGYNGNYMQVSGDNSIFNADTVYKIVYPDGNTYDFIPHNKLNGGVQFATDDNFYALKKYLYEEEMYYGIYTLQAINGSGDGQTVTEVQFRVQLTPPVVEKPQNLKATVSENGLSSITVDWTANPKYSYVAILKDEEGNVVATKNIKKGENPACIFYELEEGIYSVEVVAEYIDLVSEEAYTDYDYVYDTVLEIRCPNEWIPITDSINAQELSDFLGAKIFGNVQDGEGNPYKAKYYYLLNNLPKTENFSILEGLTGYNGAYAAVNGSEVFFKNGATASMDINANIEVNSENDIYLTYQDSDFTKAPIYLIAYDREIQINTTSVFNINKDLSYFVLRVYNQQGGYVDIPIKVETELPLIEVTGLATGVRNEGSILIEWAQTTEQINLGYKYNIYVTGPDGQEVLYKENTNCVDTMFDDCEPGTYTVRVTSVYTGYVLNEETGDYEVKTRESNGVTKTVVIEEEETVTMPGTENTYPEEGWVNISGEYQIPITYDDGNGHTKQVLGHIEVLDTDVNTQNITDDVYHVIGYNGYYMSIIGSKDYFTGQTCSLFVQREDKTVFTSASSYDKYYQGQVLVIANKLFTVTDETNIDGYTYYTLRVGSSTNYTDVLFRISADIENEYQIPEQPFDDGSEPSHDGEWTLISGQNTFDFIYNAKDIKGTIYVYDEYKDDDSKYTDTVYRTIGYNGYYMSLIGSNHYFVGNNTVVDIANESYADGTFSLVDTFENVKSYDKYYQGQVLMEVKKVFVPSEAAVYDSELNKMVQHYVLRVYDAAAPLQYTEVHYKVVYDVPVLEVDPSFNTKAIENPLYVITKDINNTVNTITNTDSYLYEQLAWTAVEGAREYKIWYSQENSTKAYEYHTVNGASTFIEPDKMPGGDYYFWVQAIDENGKQIEGEDGLRRTPILIKVSESASNSYVGSANGVWTYTVVDGTDGKNANAVIKNDWAETNVDTQDVLGATQYNFAVEVTKSGQKLTDITVEKSIDTVSGKTYDVTFTEILTASAPGTKTVVYDAYDANGSYYTVTDEIVITEADRQPNGTYSVSKQVAKKITVTGNSTTLEFQIAKSGSDTITAYTYEILDLQLKESKPTDIDNTEDEFLDVIGFQMNTNLEGVAEKSPSFRVVSGVSDTLTVGGVQQDVVAYGTVYTLQSYLKKDGASYNYSDMVIGAKDVNGNPITYQQTQVGKIDGWKTKDPAMDKHSYYALTFKNNGINAAAMNMKYVLRAYAKLADGTYVYSKRAYVASMYEIAGDLYNNNKMPTLKAHQYLYNNVLNVVAIIDNRTDMMKALLKELNITGTTNPLYSSCSKVYDELFTYAAKTYPRTEEPRFSVENVLSEALGAESVSDWIYSTGKYYSKKPYDWDNTLTDYDFE